MTGVGAKELDFVSEEFISELRRMVRQRSRHTTDTEDILQDVLLKLVKHGMDSENESLFAWIRKVVHTTAIDFYRKQKPQVPFLEATYEEDTEGPDEAVVGLAKCIRPLLAGLDAEDSALLEKVELEGRSQKEVAEQLAVGYSTVKSRVQRARQKLKSRILGCCQVELDLRNKPIDVTRKRESCC